jgi:hypothetical protein
MASFDKLHEITWCPLDDQGIWVFATAMAALHFFAGHPQAVDAIDVIEHRNRFTEAR